MTKIGQYEVKTDMLYYNNYVWVNRVSDTELYIGITDYGQASLKDITSIVNPPSEGQRFLADKDMFTIESISRDFIVKSPVSCVILEVNNDVLISPDSINENPYGSWICRLEVLDLAGLDQLIDGEDMADEILEEVSLERRSSDDNESFDDDDFDYENELSIDSADAYDDYDDDEDYYDEDIDEEDYDEDW